ncbi:MAG TPA: CsgG/HfaB family protein [Rhodanobacteraceae bacterium]|nr:CsgG/HfaB family protein [Rhodanobacteraceae bacterium]
MNKWLIPLAALSTLLASSAAPARQHSHARARVDNRPVMAVAEFKNDVNAHWWNSEVAHELSTMLSNELAATGDFRMVDRHKLDAVLREQDLANSGRVRRGSGPRTGNLTGAQYIVSGLVTAFQENSSNTGGGFSFRGIHLGGKHSEAYIAIDLQVVDAETGEVAYQRTVEGRSSGNGVNVGLYRGGFGGQLAHENNTPTGKAIRGALVEASNYLDCVMVRRDGCQGSYRDKDRRRRQSDRRAISLDG